MDPHNYTRSTAFLSNGTAKAGVVKASPGFLYGVSIGSTDETPVYVRLYDMATSPATTDTPVYRFMVPGAASNLGAAREKGWDKPLQFTAGIAYRVTTEAADNGDTATASAEVTLNFDWR